VAVRLGAKHGLSKHRGAIEDLEIFVKSGKAGKNAQRRLRWIEALRKGENPFTREEIEQLRRE
jgi:hypothetical protein